MSDEQATNIITQAKAQEKSENLIHRFLVEVVEQYEGIHFEDAIGALRDLQLSIQDSTHQMDDRNIKILTPDLLENNGSPKSQTVSRLEGTLTALDKLLPQRSHVQNAAASTCRQTSGGRGNL